MTLRGDPEELFKKLQKADSEIYALFRTEKYGTITILNRATEHSFEITPFREEDDYENHRHPEKIDWSKSLISDAKRRDFTINCLYYTTIELDAKKTKIIKNPQKNSNKQDFNKGWDDVQR